MPPADLPSVTLHGATGFTTDESPSLKPEHPLLRRAGRALRHPAQVLMTLGAVAVGVEVGQYWPELFPGAHAIGEVVRNLT